MNSSETNIKELKPGEMNFAGAGFVRRPNFKCDGACLNNTYVHEWVKTGHYEDEWLSWLKDDGLWSYGYDTYKCSRCGKTKEVRA